MKTRNFLIGCFVASAAILGCNDDENDNMVSEADRNFMMQVANSNLAEIELGQVAATRASKDSVKMFGTMMVTDHSMAQHQLDSIANQRKVDLPDVPDQAHRTLRDTLMKRTGRQFDTTYMGSQVRDHQMTLSILQSMMNTANDAALRNYATQAIPKVQMHLLLADTIRKRL
jgi:putative membrane protein